MLNCWKGNIAPFCPIVPPITPFSCLPFRATHTKLPTSRHPPFIIPLFGSHIIGSYSSVKLTSMANAFGVSVDFIDRELARFVAANRIHCKIDKVNDIQSSSPFGRLFPFFSFCVVFLHHASSLRFPLRRALSHLSLSLLLSLARFSFRSHFLDCSHES